MPLKKQAYAGHLICLSVFRTPFYPAYSEMAFSCSCCCSDTPHTRFKHSYIREAMKAATVHTAEEAACAVVDEVLLFFCGLPVAELLMMINAHVQKGHGHQDVKPEVKKFMLEHGFWAGVDAAEAAGWFIFF
jgi:hypothetical protein